jgi:hypothetical protein
VGRVQLRASGEAGFMTRDLDTANSPFVSVSVLAGGQIRVNWRLTTGGAVQTFDAPASVNTSAKWLRLTRAGSETRIEFASVNELTLDSQWQLLRSVATPGLSLRRVGLFSSSLGANTLATGTFDDVKTQGLI